MQSADGSLDGTMMNEYFEQIVPAFRKAGYDLRHGRNVEEWVKAQGFVNVTAKKQMIPVGTWAKDKKLVRISRYALLFRSRKRLTMLTEH